MAGHDASGTVEDGVMTVDLTTPTEDVTYPWSDANRYWNTQVLLAMDRAGMIRPGMAGPAGGPGREHGRAVAGDLRGTP